MKHQRFGNLQIRPLLKTSFHSFHIDFRDTSGQKIAFVYVGIARFVLMFSETSNTYIQQKRRYKLIALGQAETPL